MKKLLSILLAVCMLLTMLSLPAVAVETEDETYQYHVFDFSPGNDQFPNYRLGRQTVYEGMRSYATVITGYETLSSGVLTDPDNALASEAVDVDYVEYGGKYALRVRMKSSSTMSKGYENRLAIVPHYKDASGNWMPIKLLPGKEYNVKYTIASTRSYIYPNHRVIPEAYANSASSAFRIESGGHGASATTDGGTSGKLTTTGQSKNGYYSITGMYAPINVKDNAKTIGGTAIDIYTITKNGEEYSTPTAYTTKPYQTNGTFTYTDNLTFGTRSVEELSAWGITAQADGSYKYTLAGADQYCTDHFAITINNAASPNLYFKVSEAEIADLPDFAEVITVGGEKYAPIYEEFYITDIEFAVAGKGSVIFRDGDNEITKVGDAGSSVEIPSPSTQENFLGWFNEETGAQADSSLVFTSGAPVVYVARYREVKDYIKLEASDVKFTASNVVDGVTVNSAAVDAIRGNIYHIGGKAIIAPCYERLVQWPEDVALPSKSLHMNKNRDVWVVGEGVAVAGGMDMDNLPEVGSLRMVASQDVYAQIYTLKDADGAPILTNPNTQYMVKLAYKQLSAGKIEVRVGAGRSTAKATSIEFNSAGKDKNTAGFVDIAAVENSAYNSGYVTLGSVNRNYSSEVQYANFNFTTGAFTDCIPEMNLSINALGVLAEFTGTTYESAKADGNWANDNWGRYEIVGNAEFEIVGIEIIEVKTGNTFVNYVSYDEGTGYTETFKQGTPASAVADVPANFEGKWYKTTTSTASSNVYDNTFASNNIAVYGYGAVQEYSANNAAQYRAYIGTKGFSMVNVDGKQMLKYETLSHKESTDLNTSYNEDGTVKAVRGLTNKTPEQWAGFTTDQKLGVLNEFYGKQLWNMYRLPIEPTADGSTYKATFKYKAEGDMPMNLRLALGQETNVSDQNTNQYLSETMTITETDGWTTATMFFTIDQRSTVVENTAGADDTFTSLCNYLYLHFYSANEITEADLVDGDLAKNLEIVFSEITVENLGEVIGIEGASCLTDDAANDANQQAMRVYFSYETTTGNNIFVDGVEYTVVNRGFVYKNGAIDKYTTNGKYNADMKKGQGIIESEKTSGFNTGWAYDTEEGRLWFSNYIRNFDSSMLDSKIIARGYVTFTDGVNEYTIYSDTINRSVNGIKALNGNTIEQYK